MLQDSLVDADWRFGGANYPDYKCDIHASSTVQSASVICLHETQNLMSIGVHLQVISTSDSCQ